MAKIDKRIEIVSTTVPVLSSMSRESRDAVQTALAKTYTEVGVCIVNDLNDLEDLVARRPDLVFLGMKYLPVNPRLGWRDPDKIWLSRYLDERGIAYTGSGQSAHRLELDKPSAKQRALAAGLDTAPFFVIKQGQTSTEADTGSLRFPLFVKPTDRGGGVGVDSDSIVRDLTQLNGKSGAIAFKLQSDSLVEEYLSGREFSVALMLNEATAELDVMPIELVAQPDEHGERLLSQAAKAADTESVLAVSDGPLKLLLSNLATAVFKALGARDYGRIDIRLDDQGVPNFLEANLQPSLIEGYGNFPKACMLNGELDYESMLLRIVDLALVRQPETTGSANPAALPVPAAASA